MTYDRVKQSPCLFKGTDIQIQPLLENNVTLDRVSIRIANKEESLLFKNEKSHRKALQPNGQNLG